MHAHHTAAPRRTTSPQPHSTHRRHHGLRSIAHQLTPETIEQIARRVTQLLREPTEHHASEPHAGSQQPTGLLTATQLAHKLGVNRSWVYQNAHKLGAITLGNGPKPRLRFDPQTTTTILTANNTPTAAAVPAAKRTSQRGRPRKQAPPTVPLLPIHPRSIRGLLTRLPIRRAR